ncbi:GumC family protein [Maribacter aquivivus]|uniref:GumC family protein n=1 Tax=Maribacter aquivivus TaxID=228958 RepID=UPI0024959699|nr:polysaccharide biosynthesis tyrosine autokinase [Maribacter aquivivus]
MSEFQMANQRQQNLFHIILQKFLPFWPLFLMLAFLGLLLASLYLFTTTPMYQSSAAIIVNDEKKGVNESQLLDSFNVFEPNKIVENEIEVLKSKIIIEDAVVTLGLNAIVSRSNFFSSEELYENSPVKIAVMDSYNLGPNNTGKEDIEFFVDFDNGAVIIDKQEIPFDTWTSNPSGGSSIKFLPNGFQDYDKTKKFKYRIVSPQKIVNKIRNNLYVGAASKNSTVVWISYTDAIAYRGIEIVDQIIESYKKAAILEQGSLASNTLTFIDQRILEVGADLEKVEKDLEKYRTNEGVIDLGEQGDLYLRNVGEYDRRISEINLQLSVLDKVERYVISKNKNSGIVPSTLGVDDPILGQLLQRLYDAEIEYAELSKTVAENNPMLVVVKNRIDKIRPSILENVRSQKSNLIASRGSLTTNSSKYNDALNVLPEQERIFLEISRRKKSIADLYEFLIQKREETALSYAPTSGNIRVIEKADSSYQPVSPKRSFVYLLGLLLPLGLGFVWVAGKELLNTKILFRSELELDTLIPVLGELAFVDKTTNNLLVSQHKDLFIVDQFRRILTDMHIYDGGETIKTVMVTSSISGEGKSYVSANLAVTLALSGKKTALIDMDLRRSGVTQLFELQNNVGMSQVLNQGCSLDIGLQLEQNLTVFPSGPKTLDSSNLLVGDNWKTFITTIKQEYEAVIIDTPPTTLVSDAAILANFVDKTIIVVRHDHTPKFILQHIDETVIRKGFEQSAIIFNGIKMRGVIKKGYGYGYGYEPGINESEESFLFKVIRKFKEIRTSFLKKSN